MLTFICCLCVCLYLFSFFFFFNDTATTEIYTLSLHDALPIFIISPGIGDDSQVAQQHHTLLSVSKLLKNLQRIFPVRSEEHTSELQSRLHLVCRLLLEKKKKKKNITY